MAILALIQAPFGRSRACIWTRMCSIDPEWGCKRPEISRSRKRCSDFDPHLHAFGVLTAVAGGRPNVACILFESSLALCGWDWFGHEALSVLGQLTRRVSSPTTDAAIPYTIRARCGLLSSFCRRPGHHHSPSATACLPAADLRNKATDLLLDPVSAIPFGGASTLRIYFPDGHLAAV